MLLPRICEADGTVTIPSNAADQCSVAAQADKTNDVILLLLFITIITIYYYYYYLLLYLLLAYRTATD